MIMSDVSAFQASAGKTVKRRGRPGWLTLADAASILANPEPLSESESPPPAEIRDRLFEALSTGEVTAMIDNGHISRPMRTRDFFETPFAFNFGDSSVRLFHGPGGEFDCVVHERQLRAFALIRDTSSKKISVARRHEIIQWIANFIDSAQYYSKDATLPLICAQFKIKAGLARDLFDLAKTQAKREGISKRGRKKKTPN
ncbi:MAG: hypothetical protein ABUS57_02100 [Pseudomonadota bacterium]